MKTTKKFIENCDRYVFDFGPCSPKNGFAQIDTEEDASYYGNWVNPTTLKIVSYVEGDVYIHKAETPEELVAELRKIKASHDERGYKFKGIDDMMDDAIRDALVAIGAGDLLYA